MSAKQVLHYFMVVLTFICMFEAILLLTNEFFKFFDDSVLKIFSSTEILLGILFIFSLLLLKIKFKVKLSEFNSNDRIDKWKSYVVIFQLLFFITLFVIRNFCDIVFGNSCFLILLSLFYWAVDIGYIVPLLEKGK